MPIKRLPPLTTAQRQRIQRKIMAMEKQMTRKEVAAILGTSPGMIYRVLHWTGMPTKGMREYFGIGAG